MPNSYQVTLTWPSYPNQGTITSLVVSRDSVDIATLPASATTFTDDGSTIAGAVLPLTTYDYAVTVNFNNGCPARALDAIVDVGCYADAPTNVTLTDNGDGTATVDWFPPGAGLPFFGYKISWSSTPGGPYTDGFLFVPTPAALTADISTGAGTWYVVVQGMDSETCLSTATEEATIVVTGSPGQDFGITWEPPEVDLPALAGKFAYNNGSNLAGITDITFSETTNREGYDLESAPDLLTLSWPNLIDITDAGYLDIEQCTLLTLITFGSLTAVPSVSIRNNPALTTLTGLAGVNFTGPGSISSNTAITLIDLSNCTFTGSFGCAGNTSLFIIGISGATFPNGTDYDFSGNALTQATVDAILAAMVANAGYASGNVDLSGGTSSAPSVTGLADKATLIGRGVSVTTN
jgi:hypothetical protein